MTADWRHKKYAEIKARLAEVLGYEFTDESFIIQALSHKSVPHKSTAPKDNSERLEFLGDRVLGVVISDMLFRQFPGDSEGDLAKRFSRLVNKECLAEVADTIGLEEYIFTASAPSQVPSRPKLLADTIEAVIGALYCDGGEAAAKAFILHHWQEAAQAMKRPPTDVKSALQEWSMKELQVLPEYVLLEQTGPSHEPQFTIKVSLPGIGEARATGKSRKQAELRAAEKLYSKVQNEQNSPR